MATNLIIPSVGESVSEVTILEWTKNDGDYVNQDDAVALLETDKANVDLRVPVGGLFHPTKPVGYVAKVGEVVGQIDESAKPSQAAPRVAAVEASAPAASNNGGSASTSAAVPAKSTAAPAAQAPSAKSVEDLSPSVRKMVVENKVDPATVAPTGPGGRILKEDVQKVLDAPASDNGQAQANKAPQSAPAKAPAVEPTAPVAKAPPVQAPPPEAVPRTAPATIPPAAHPSKPLTEALPLYDANGIARVPMSKIRKRIAMNLLQAQQTAAILTTFNEIDLTAVSEIRTKYKEKFEKAYGVGLGFMSFFARAVVLALREFPRVNAFMDGDDVLYHNYVNLGVAVSTDRGLTVPVLHGVDQMSFAKIESEIKRLAGASREGKLSIPELSGGTFTITNGGVFGSLLSTPILNPPQSGILGMHAIQKRPVAIGDKIEIRPMMYVALSYDHRIVDGRESVSFLVRVKEYLEDPARLMLEI